MLQALRQARFSLFVVESAEPGVGVHVRDLLRDEPRFLVDVGLGRTATVGMVLAARAMAPDGIGMTTGAALPVGAMSAADRVHYLDDLKVRGIDFETLPPTESSELTATVLRTYLRDGAPPNESNTSNRVTCRPAGVGPATTPARAVAGRSSNGVAGQ